jgi:hypothetical protein
MTRTISWVGAIALSALGAAACGDDAYIDFPAAGGSASIGSSGAAGAAGGTGIDGAADAGGSSAGAGGSAAVTGVSAGGAGVQAAGTTGGDADGGGAETPDAGDADASVEAPAAPAAPDPTGTSSAITSVPFTREWQTNDDTADVLELRECQLCDNTGDYILTFTAPATATYRFLVTSGADVELTVYPGDDLSEPDDVSCGQDINARNDNHDDRLDLDIARGGTVTVVIGESCEEFGGAGTLTIQVAP